MPFKIITLFNILLIQKLFKINNRQAIENITQFPGLMLHTSRRTDCENKIASYILYVFTFFNENLICATLKTTTKFAK